MAIAVGPWPVLFGRLAHAATTEGMATALASYVVSEQGRLRISEDVVFEVVAGEAVLLHLGTGVYFTLNPTGTRFWQLVEEGEDLDRVRERMLAEFDVPAERLVADLERLVGELEAKGLLVREKVGR